MIRPATPADHDAVWAILEPVIRDGETYTLDRDMTREEALTYWFSPGHIVLVTEDCLGTYYLRRNQGGGGSHVANCGYMTALTARGKGLARAMCAHSLVEARDRGFRAMQFNFVVSTNTRAVALWESFGFATVGRLPQAFAHPTAGDVDALLMFRHL